ncbi:MAG: histidine--tRNA ligase [Oscillospiraceae bacterium]|nr:histidine--tRNA ligase [Oscillospiraceae bacterium]
MEKITAPRGTKDVLPSESHQWQYLEAKLRDVARRFGFKEIRFPTFEEYHLFCRGVGDTTDVVQKEMYDFYDKGERHIALRPEGTASVVRSFIEHSLHAQTLPLKVFYIAPNFRYEKPQAGRLREHHQFGIECFGSYDASSDAEVISVAATMLEELGLSNIELHINSCGCPNCRPAYHTALKEYFESKKADLCGTCLDRLDRNPMRILDCKSPVCSEIAKDAPIITDYLCDECTAHFAKLREYLDAAGIAYVCDPRIVRGLDYYTNTVFEFITDSIGAQSTICGGGRYNGLVESLGGPKTAGLGFGSGLERLLLTMEAQGATFPEPDTPDLFLAAMGEEADRAVQTLVYELRKLGVAAERDTCGRSLKAQMKYADKLSAAYSAVIGEQELIDGKIALKNMQTGEKSDCDLSASAIFAHIMEGEE